MKYLLMLSGALLAAASVIAITAPSSPTSAATVNVDATDDASSNFFSPATIDITVGDTVTWTFSGAAVHTVTRSGLPEQFSSGPPKLTGAFPHTFTQAGSYTYVCVIHSGMNGTVNVTAAAADTATAAPQPTVTNPPSNTPQSTFTPGPSATATPTSIATTTAAQEPGTTPIGVASSAADAGVASDASSPAATPIAQQLPRTGDAASSPRDSIWLSILLATSGAAGIGTSIALRRRL